MKVPRGGPPAPPFPRPGDQQPTAAATRTETVLRSYLTLVIGPERADVASRRVLCQLAVLPNPPALDTPDSAALRTLAQTAGLDELDARARKIQRRIARAAAGHLHCAALGNRLRARAEGRISAAELDSFYRHLEGCPVCAEAAGRFDAGEWYLQRELGHTGPAHTGVGEPAAVANDAARLAAPAANAPVAAPSVLNGSGHSDMVGAEPGFDLPGDAVPHHAIGVPAAAATNGGLATTPDTPAAVQAPLPTPAATAPRSQVVSPPRSDPEAPRSDGEVRPPRAKRRLRRTLAIVAGVILILALAGAAIVLTRQTPKRSPLRAPAVVQPKPVPPSTSAASPAPTKVTVGKLGAPFVLAGARFTVAADSPEPWAAFAKTVSPGSGNRWQLATVRVFDRSRVDLDPRVLHYRLIGQGGVAYYPNPAYGTGPEIRRPARPLRSGAVVEVRLAFAIPRTATGLQLAFDPTGHHQRVVVALAG